MQQLRATVPISSGSQQSGLWNQSVCKSDTAIKEVELLADVYALLKESICATIPSSGQV